MDFNKLKTEIKKSNYSIKKIAEKIGLSEQGLHSAIRNGTLKIRDLESISEILKIKVSSFFDENTKKQEIQVIGKNNQIANNGYIINYEDKYKDCLKEISYLKQQIKDKEEIIELLKKQ